MRKFIYLILTCGLLMACNNVDKEQLKQEIIKELQENKPLCQKGNGWNFYNEQVCIGEDGGYYIHHSTLECPAIQSGVQRNFVYTNREDRNLFCSKCMDDVLINTFNETYFSKKK